MIPPVSNYLTCWKYICLISSVSHITTLATDVLIRYLNLSNRIDRTILILIDVEVQDEIENIWEDNISNEVVNNVNEGTQEACNNFNDFDQYVCNV